MGKNVLTPPKRKKRKHNKVGKEIKICRINTSFLAMFELRCKIYNIDLFLGVQHTYLQKKIVGVGVSVTVIGSFCTVGNIFEIF
jgi:hypothetical protein